MKDTTIEDFKDDFETLLSLAVEVKKNNTDEFMTCFRERVSGFISKYFGGDDETTIQTT